MIPDLDAYRAAKPLIDRRARGAVIFAVGRADLLLGEGRPWRRGAMATYPDSDREAAVDGKGQKAVVEAHTQ
jgi:hypothetical protein